MDYEQLKNCRREILDMLNGKAFDPYNTDFRRGLGGLVADFKERIALKLATMAISALNQMDPLKESFQKLLEEQLTICSQCITLGDSATAGQLLRQFATQLNDKAWAAAQRSMVEFIKDQTKNLDFLRGLEIDLAQLFSRKNRPRRR
jgi:thioredoxin-like negative regulator of GroEL